MADPNKVGKMNGWGWDRRTTPRKGRKKKEANLPVAEPADWQPVGTVEEFELIRSEIENTDKEFREQYMNEPFPLTMEDIQNQLRREAQAALGVGYDIGYDPATGKETAVAATTGRSPRVRVVVLDSGAQLDAIVRGLRGLLGVEPPSIEDTMKKCESLLETHENLMEHFK